MLSLLSAVSFLLPPDGGERMSIGVTTLLSFTVFGLVVVERVPEESDHTPLFSKETVSNSCSAQRKYVDLVPIQDV